MKLIPNPEYELAEYGEHYIYSPAVPKPEHHQEPLPRRWRSKDYAAVVEAWNKHDWETLNRLSVPSHILVEESP